MINLDTHMLVFALSGEISTHERHVLADNPWGTSAIVLWELAKLAQLGRVEIDLVNRDVVRLFSGLHVWPLDLAVSVQSTRLDFRGDPADEIIATTSIVHGVPLLTRGRVIRRSGLVPLASRAAATRSGSAEIRQQDDEYRHSPPDLSSCQTRNANRN